MTFGEKLKDIRRRFYLTQEQLSRIVDVSRQTIAKWESDLSVPDEKGLQLLSNTFGISVNSLVNDKELPLLVMRVELDRDRYKNKLGSYETILKDYFFVCEIYNLVRSRKMSILGTIIDFFVFGLNNDIDTFSDLSPYYLIKKNGSKFLVNIKNWVLEISELPLEINDKKFVFGKNKFVNCGRLVFKK